MCAKVEVINQISKMIGSVKQLLFTLAVFIKAQFTKHISSLYDIEGDTFASDVCMAIWVSRLQFAHNRFTSPLMSGRVDRCCDPGHSTWLTRLLMFICLYVDGVG